MYLSNTLKKYGLALSISCLMAKEVCNHNLIPFQNLKIKDYEKYIYCQFWLSHENFSKSPFCLLSFLLPFNFIF